MTESELQLGPIQLLEPVGSGGLGTVWRGTIDDHPVAIKIARSADPTALSARALHREVVAAARLRHRGFVDLLDAGAVSAADAERSGGRFEAGMPFLVTELLVGGRLREPASQPAAWPHLREVLLALLEALAHAHGRGVLHRDVKPANILFRESGGQPVLVDLGIADLGEPFAERVDAGTPSYLAPEQLVATTRSEQGPWTDIYGLCCTVFAVLTGRPPFYGASLDEIVAQHLSAPVPPLIPRFAVPDGFRAWLERGLAKHPIDRFSSAAAAAEALRAIDNDTSTAPTSTAAATPPVTDTSPSTERLPQLDQTVAVTRTEHSAEPTGAPLPIPVPIPRRPPGSVPSTQRPPSTGLGVLTHRQLAPIGRDRDQHVIWRTLRRVANERRPHLIVLRGAPGCGKSALARWLIGDAHEAAGIGHLRADHAAGGGAALGLAGLVASAFGVHGVDASEATKSIRLMLRTRGIDDAYEAAILATIATAGHDRNPPAVRVESPRQVHSAVLRLLSRRATHQPLIVWFDDVQWGIDALTLLRRSLDELTSSPILFVATVRDDALDARPEAAALLADLAGHDRTTTRALAPLADEDIERIVGSLVPAAPVMARAAALHARGIPMLALQRLGLWADTNKLEWDAQGWTLAEAVEPLDLDGIWLRRVEQALVGPQRSLRHDGDGTVTRAWLVIRLAAALGTHVDTAEWSAAARRLGAEHLDRTVEQLLAAGLVDERAGGWSFVHGRLRDALVASCGEDVLRELHGAIADGLQELYSDHALSPVHGRRGTHLARAGRFDEAVDAYALAINADVYLGGVPRARRRLAELRQLASARTDDLALGAHVARVGARVELHAGEVAEAESLLARAQSLDPTPDSARSRYEDAFVEGWILKQRGAYRDAEVAYLRSRDLALAFGETRAAANSLSRAASALARVGELEEALSISDLDVDESRGLDDARLADALNVRARLLINMGRYDEAMKTLDEATGIAERAGYWYALSQHWNAMGEIHRSQGRFGPALEAYARCAALMDATGFANHAFTARLNRIVAFVAAERLDDAADAAAALQLLAPRCPPLLELAWFGAQLVRTAHRRLATETDDYLARATTLLDARTLADRDISGLFATAAARMIDLRWRKRRQQTETLAGRIHPDTVAT